MFKRRKPDDPPSDEPNLSRAAPLPGAMPVHADSGVGIPPYRPTPLPASAAMIKEPSMARSPFATAQTAPPSPVAASIPPTRSTAMVAPRREPAERRTLVVGRGISLQGVVQDAERLVVEGTVEATMIHAAELSVTPGGVFKGEVEVEDAEVAGTIDGTLTARGSLIVRSSGRVLGTARCRRLQVEDGGQITGRIEMLTEAQAAGEMRELMPHPHS